MIVISLGGGAQLALASGQNERLRELVALAERQMLELQRIRLGSEMAVEETLSAEDASDTGISN